MNRITSWFVIAAMTVALAPAAADPPVEKITFKDPVGDDHGPGSYTYPTDAAYTRGSFDLTEFSVSKQGDRLRFDVTVGARLEDPWEMKSGFSVQMVFIFIQTDNRQGDGFTDTVPGLNVKFAPADAWDKLVILSPHPPGRVETEVEQKVAAAEQSSVIVPDRVKGAGRTISTSVELARLGGGDPSKWGYQVVIQSNEGYPEGTDLLTRKVNRLAGQHRFGGGADDDCDPHVIDTLAGKGQGGADEISAQHEMLKYECHPDGTVKQSAVLKMVRK
jgi:carbohydrate-binding DOMON domain-containing protein